MPAASGTPPVIGSSWKMPLTVSPIGSPSGSVTPLIVIGTSRFVNGQARTVGDAMAAVQTGPWFVVVAGLIVNDPLTSVLWKVGAASLALLTTGVIVVVPSAGPADAGL